MNALTLHVAADDRTGALETAAVLADRSGSPVPVAVWPDYPPAGGGVSVVDLSSRHLDATEAAARASTLHGSGRLAHKIDSTLRGNWSSELVARAGATGQPVLLVPSLPSLGRICVDGVVLLGGLRADEGAAATDVRGAPATARPADALEAAGATVHSLHDMPSVTAWLRDPAGIAVADAADDETIEGIVDRWRGVDGVLLAGTSAVIGAAVGRATRPPSRRHVVQPPTLVVVGSAHPAVRAQISHAAGGGAVVTERFEPSVLRAMLAGTPVILCSGAVLGTVTADLADAEAQRLLHEAGAVIESGHVGTLILIGGDTAAALLGEALVVVHGSVRPGTALVESLVVDVPVITRSGGFGSFDALTELLWERGS